MKSTCCIVWTNIWFFVIKCILGNLTPQITPVFNSFWSSAVNAALLATATAFCCPCFLLPLLLPLLLPVATAIATAISFGTHESAPGTLGAAPDAATTGAIASGCHFCRWCHFCHFCRCCHVCHQCCSFLHLAEPGAETAEQVVCSLQEGCSLAAGSVRAM